LELVASSKGKDQEVVEMGLNEVTTPRLVNDAHTKIDKVGAKVPLESIANLATVVHENSTQLIEAHIGQGPNVEHATLPVVNKGKGVIHIVGVIARIGGTWRPLRHLFKLDLEKVKELLEVAFKPPQGQGQLKTSCIIGRHMQRGESVPSYLFVTLN
jgi:hypothetical protein